MSDSTSSIDDANYPIDATEFGKALIDACILGTGATQDGKHITPHQNFEPTEEV